MCYVVPAPHDPRPGRYVRHIDFNHFRTIGMRRSVEEGVNNRFVTGDRLQAVLKVSLPTFVCRLRVMSSDTIWHVVCRSYPTFWLLGRRSIWMAH